MAMKKRRGSESKQSATVSEKSIDERLRQSIDRRLRDSETRRLNELGFSESELEQSPTVSEQSIDERLRLLFGYSDNSDVPVNSGNSDVPEFTGKLTKKEFQESFDKIITRPDKLITDSESSLEDFERLIDEIEKLLLISNKEDGPEIKIFSEILSDSLKELEIERTKRQIEMLKENYLELIREMGKPNVNITILEQKFISLMKKIMLQRDYMRDDEIFVELKPILERLKSLVYSSYEQLIAMKIQQEIEERQKLIKQTHQHRERHRDGFNPRRSVLWVGSGKLKRKRKQTRKTHKLKRSKHKYSKHKKSHKPKKTLKRKYKKNKGSKRR